MSMTRSMTDLELTLYNGNMQDVPTAAPEELQRLYFDIDLIRIRNVGNQFQKTTTDAYKSDREMTVCEMQAAQDRSRKEYEVARREFVAKRATAIKSGVKLSKEVMNARTSAPWDIGLGRAYCKAISFVSVSTAGAQSVTRGPPPSSGITDMSSPPMLEALRLRLNETARIVSSYAVEIHKKFALAVACFVFVLLGAPIALRFPRGGVGLTIGVSLFVFALYYVCLIAGESLGKRGLVAPVVSMWAANVAFALVAVWLLSKIGREARTARGGDMGEMLDAIRGWVREKLGIDRRRRRALERSPA
jgi:lipopolysaccharide export system permease protein